MRSCPTARTRSHRATEGIRRRSRTFHFRTTLRTRCSRACITSRSKPAKRRGDRRRPTGGGKSTVMSLIPRFYDPSDGACGSTASTCANTHWRVCESRSATCCRIPCSSAARFARTSPTDAPTQPGTKSMRSGENGQCPRIHRQKMPKGYETMVGERGADALGRATPANRNRAGHRP